MKIQFLLLDSSGTFKNKMAHYDKFKEEIIKKINHPLPLEEVKNYYKGIINSRRKLSRAKTLSDIFHLLEERDALDCNNIAVLKHLGTVLQNEEIKKLVHGYEKLYTEQDYCVCGKIKIFSLPIINPEIDNNGGNECNELQTAVSNISLNIGKNWRLLASELKVKERYIDEVRDKYPDDFRTQALKILEIWIQSNAESASLDKLKKALESRQCKRKGIGLHMLKPPITVE